MFVAKISKDGYVLWAQQYGGSGSEVGYGLKLANNGDVIVTGSFDKSFSFGYKYLKAKKTGDVLVARFSPDGKLKWANQVGLEEIGLTEKFMFMAEFKFSGSHIKKNEMATGRTAWLTRVLSSSSRNDYNNPQSESKTSSMLFLGTGNICT